MQDSERCTWDDIVEGMAGYNSSKEHAGTQCTLRGERAAEGCTRVRPKSVAIIVYPTGKLRAGIRIGL